MKKDLLEWECVANGSAPSLSLQSPPPPPPPCYCGFGYIHKDALSFIKTKMDLSFILLGYVTWHNTKLKRRHCYDTTMTWHLNTILLSKNIIFWTGLHPHAKATPNENISMHAPQYHIKCPHMKIRKKYAEPNYYSDKTRACGFKNNQ